MPIQTASIAILQQLRDVVSQLKKADISKPVPTLNNSTIGQHVRHTLEFYTCLLNGCKTGSINYDLRDHDTVIECEKELLLILIDDIITFLKEENSTPVQFTLEVNYDLTENSPIKITTNLARELAYNIEHAIHHMAIIKIGLNEVAPYIEIPEHFGVAISTIRHQQTISENK